MAQRVVRLPDIGEGTTEAEIVAWRVKPGDVVREEDPLAEVMTDKATVEIPAPVGGRVVSINGKVGEKLAVGSDFVVLEVGGSEAAAPRAAEAASPTPVVEPAPRPISPPASREKDDAPPKPAAPLARRGLG